MSVVSFHAVSKHYENATAVDAVSFDIAAGEIVGILGPNGAGKTTCVRLATGVVQSDQGTIRTLGEDPLAKGTAIRKQCGVLTESSGLYLHLTARENLEFSAQLFHQEDPQYIQELLDLFGLKQVQNQRTAEYSTGMRKRLGIARALLHRPRLLFLDEPTNGLDPAGARDLVEYIQRLNREQQVTVILCTHLLRQVQDLCTRFLFLHQGRLVETGTLQQLEASYLKNIRLQVETSIPAEAMTAAGWEAVAQDKEGFLTLSLPSKEIVPECLRSLTSLGDIFSVEILDRDLETLYFRVLEAGRRG